MSESPAFFAISDLHVAVDGKEILCGVGLRMGLGEVHVLWKGRIVTSGVRELVDRLRDEGYGPLFAELELADEAEPVAARGER